MIYFTCELFYNIHILNLYKLSNLIMVNICSLQPTLFRFISQDIISMGKKKEWENIFV